MLHPPRKKNTTAPVVLIIDTDRDFLGDCVMPLVQAGYEVLTALDSQEVQYLCEGSITSAVRKQNGIDDPDDAVSEFNPPHVRHSGVENQSLSARRITLAVALSAAVLFRRGVAEEDSVFGPHYPPLTSAASCDHATVRITCRSLRANR